LIVLGIDLKYVHLTLWLAVCGAMVGGFTFLGYKLERWHDAYVLVPQLEAKLASYREAYDRALADAATASKLDAAARAQLTAELDAERGASAELRLATSRIKTTTEVIHEGSTCPTVRLSDAFGVCVQASVSGDRSAVAACEAAGGNGSVRTDTGR
jgi:hypothetical protein